MRPSRDRMPLPIPCLGWLLLLAYLSACGPAVSDDPSNTTPPTSVIGQEARGTGLGESNLAPLASSRSPAGHSEARPAETLVVPYWMAKELHSPDVRVRLRALETWGQQAPTGSVDLLIVALDDEDERVRAKALGLIEQDWVRAQVAKPEAEK